MCRSTGSKLQVAAQLPISGIACQVSTYLAKSACFSQRAMKSKEIYNPGVGFFFTLFLLGETQWEQGDSQGSTYQPTRAQQTRGSSQYYENSLTSQTF